MLKPFRTFFDDMHKGKYDFDEFLNGREDDSSVEKFIENKIVHIASDKLRAYHAFLNLYVIRNLKVNKEVVFSYRKGVNIADAVRRHSSSKHFYQTDLKNFFTSIDSSLVTYVLNNSRGNMPFSDPDKYIERIVELTTVDGRIPAGFSTSPAISNACLFRFDEMFKSYCDSKNLIYTRYSDDIIVSGLVKADVSEAVGTIDSMIKQIYGNKFTINNCKSKFTHVGRKIKLLGMVVLPNGSVSVDMRIKKRIEILIHYYVVDGIKFLSLVEDDLHKGMQTVSGYLSFINTVDKIYLDKLRKKYGQDTVDMFLHLPTA